MIKTARIHLFVNDTKADAKSRIQDWLQRYDAIYVAKGTRSVLLRQDGNQYTVTDNGIIQAFPSADAAIGRICNIFDVKEASPC